VLAECQQLSLCAHFMYSCLRSCLHFLHATLSLLLCQVWPGSDGRYGRVPAVVLAVCSGSKGQQQQRTHTHTQKKK